MINREFQGNVGVLMTERVYPGRQKAMRILNVTVTNR